MSREHLLKKSLGSLPHCLLVRLSGSYIVLAANGPHLPIFPPLHPLSSLPHFIFSPPPPHPPLQPPPPTYQLLCLFSSTVAISPSVIDIILGVRSSLICVSYFGGGQWGRWVALSLRLCELILLSLCRAEVMDHSEITSTDKLFSLLMPVINRNILLFILQIQLGFFFVVWQSGSCPAYAILQFIRAKLFSYAPIYFSGSHLDFGLSPPALHILCFAFSIHLTCLQREKCLELK